MSFFIVSTVRHAIGIRGRNTRSYKNMIHRRAGFGKISKVANIVLFSDMIHV